MVKKDKYSSDNNLVKYKKLENKELNEQVEKARSGDELAYKEVLCHMHRYLCRLKDEFFIQGADSEDVYQEGAIKLINVIDKYDESKGKFNAFAQSSIRKHIITEINRQQAKKRQPLNKSYSLDAEISSSDDDGKITFMDNLAVEQDQFGNTQFEIIQQDYEQYLVKKISEVLSIMEGKVFYYRFLEGLSYKEIAIELDLYRRNRKNGEYLLCEETKIKLPDQKSVDNAIMRSRPKIKKVLERLGVAPTDLENFTKGPVTSKKKRGRPRKKKVTLSKRGKGRPLGSKTKKKKIDRSRVVKKK